MDLKRDVGQASGPEAAQRERHWARQLVRFLRTILGLRKKPAREPFDFQRVEFERLDVDQVASQLRLKELARANGSAGIPRTDDQRFDGPHERIRQYIEGEVARIAARFERTLGTINYRIAESQPVAHLNRVDEVPAQVAAQLRDLEAHYQRERDLRSTSLDATRLELDAFRQQHRLTREPRYPDSRMLAVATLFAVWVAEGLINMLFFARGSDFGLVGGAMQALVLALADVSLVFFLGRGVACLVSRQWRFRLAGGMALVAFCTWAVGFNLLVGHIREALQDNVSDPMTTALANFLAAPLGLDQADSWILVIIGLALSVIAMFDGLNWDERYPGYGKLHRRFVSDRQQLDYLEAERRHRIASLRQDALNAIDSHEARARNDLIILSSDIELKNTLLNNVRLFRQHYQDSYNALIQLYRDENTRARSTPPPRYFNRRPPLQIPDELSDDTGADATRLTEAREAVAAAADRLALARSKVHEYTVDAPSSTDESPSSTA